MTYEHLYGLEESREDVPYLKRFNSRGDDLKKLQKARIFDVLIVGGGIHGAALARLAAFNGLRTLLLEKHDYAWATSSRSSKMVHGGLRYLEMFDFQQVFEGIKAREDLFTIASHIARPHRFQIPVFRDQKYFRWKARIGLVLYDLFLRNRSLRHQWRDSASLPQEGFPPQLPNLVGCFEYCDGIMDDARLVLEMILSARQEGAVCLNYARFDSSKHEKDDTVTVGLTDILDDRKYEVRCGIVVNCAGPWAPTLGKIAGTRGNIPVRFSQGTHLLFPEKWDGPALFLPLEEKGRYYFVWPHFAGTLVGTTERELPTLPEDPQPSMEEIHELLARVKRDLSWSKLATSSPHYAFAGVRILPARTSRPTAKLSRRHIWHFENGMLTLLGGKFTTASWTAEEGLRKVFRLAGLHRSLHRLRGRKLPGGFVSEESRKNFVEKCRERNIPEPVVNRVIGRYGSRAGYFLDDEKGLELVGGEVLYGELQFAFLVEQAISFDDVLQRRLGLQYLPGHGKSALSDIVRAASEILGDRTEGIARFSSGLDHYQKQNEQVLRLLAEAQNR
jgi:glycerol-3-phosphate dehydrogenase